MISIIIATYNTEKNISKCLNSIIQQKDGVELIIIDGNSSDNTKIEIERYRAVVDIFISENDSGIYDAWNKGIKSSKGHWIMFLGADDLLLPDAIKNYKDFIENAESEDYDLITSKVKYIFNPQKKYFKVIGKKWQWKEFKHQMQIAHVGALHNRRLFDEIGLFNTDYKIVGDYELLLRKKDKLKAGYMDKIVAEMTGGGVSFSTKAIVESLNAKINTANLNPILAYIDIIFEYIIFKTYYLRRRIEKIFKISKYGKVY